ncbi:MAG: aspartate carbamoyltransferase [Prolixibacteraceae bacterium]|jgi:aspartate carbamoyltransferase catalytic subunit|nr:aspartate carbamoyltransferase [Prolixibacteraceae bacterium]MDD4756070.1 aspartate carbamoyltransferase [Prolixibacteraceae bacterium]NLO00941.1 aspartate carbamoyltransferase [Bacteroidales bacterium]
MKKDLISITDYSKEEYLKIMRLAAEFEENPDQDLLGGQVVATLFFEPSTRTRLSFETAINRLGGKIIGIADPGSSSAAKGESLHDSIRMVSQYANLIVMRHPLDGAARYAAEVSPVPVINAGDGSNQHPTQTLLDMYSILKTQGTLDNLNIFMVGDLKYGRTVHSLLMAMSAFKNPIFNFISPAELQMPNEYKIYLREKNIRYFEHREFSDIISEADIIYMTRVQKERFSDPIEYEQVKNAYVLRNAMLEKTKPNLRILHPLPRVNEIHTDVDTNEKAYYFNQALNGVYTREAIIAHTMNLK